MTVPVSTPYSAFNVTVTAKAGSPAPVAPIIFTLTVAAKVAVNPTVVGGPNFAQKQVTVDVNITNAPPFSGFIVAIFFNYSSSSVLQNPQVDYSGGALGNDAPVSTLCINGVGSQCIPDSRFDGQGVVSLALITASGKNSTTSNGNLFSITFDVKGAGFSVIHFAHQEVFTAHYVHDEPTVLKTAGFDGYFANKECGAQNPCKPPVVSFIPPLRIVQNRPVSFNGTAVSQNPAGFITEYDWAWGLGQDIHYYNSPSTNVTITFLQIGEHVVTLSAQDSFGARAYYTLSIEVIRVWIDLGFASLSIDHSTGVIPGTVVHIVVTAVNNGVNPENSTITLSINNDNMGTKPIQNLGPDVESSFRFDWNTASYAPRVYQVVADLATVKNATTGQILENDTSINSRGQIVDLNNVRTTFIQLILPLPSGFGAFLGLNLPETLALGIVLIAVVVFLFGLVKKARAPPPEPL